MHGIKAFFTSLGMYTRLPIKPKSFKETSSQSLLLNLVIVGGLIGVLWWLFYDFIIGFNISKVVLSAIVMLFPYWITGYLHLDGYMDVSALILSRRGGYTNNERHNAFGMIALAVLFVINYASIYHFIDIKDTSILLIFIPIISRELTVLMIFLFPALSGSDYEVYKNSKKSEFTVILMILFVITIVFCITLAGIRGSILIVAMLCSFLFSIISAKENCGMSGDTAGYALTISEVIGLLALAIFKF